MAKNSVAEPAPQSRLVKISYRLHPELRKALKVGAAIADQSMEQQLHIALCQAFDRPDLLDQGPDAFVGN